MKKMSVREVVCVNGIKPHGTITVCLADDDPMIRALFSRVVKRAGCHVLPAAGNCQAQALLAENLVHLVVSDLMMPDIVDGESLLECVLQEYPGIPVCMMSGNWDSEVRNKLLKRGASACIEKPFTAETFAELVDELVWKAEADQSE